MLSSCGPDRVLLPRILALLLVAASGAGCAVHYFDAETGTEHIWGFGHMKMKVARPDEGIRAVIHGTDVFGASVGKALQHSYVTLGWQRLQFIEVLEADTTLRLEWPTSSFLEVRVGSEFPPHILGAREEKTPAPAKEQRDDE